MSKTPRYEIVFFLCRCRFISAAAVLLHMDQRPLAAAQNCAFVTKDKANLQAIFYLSFTDSKGSFML